ncbi:MAG TPA: EamA family transporter [Chitinivibrionales bacterium]|nr:EamA family transporter [Chitinivibrionales bacterium]
MITGLLLGFGAAFFQSCSYLFSKRYVAKFEKSTVGLLVAAHCIMGIFSLALLPFFLPATMPPFSRYAIPLICGVWSYLAAQACFFLSLKTTEASRVSPLLGLKIIILALISILFLRQHFSVAQWGGICLSIVAACLLGLLGNRLNVRSWAWVLGACFFYSLSDICIKQLITCFVNLGLLRASVLSTCLSYVLAGLVSVACMPLFPFRSFSRWRLAFPFAAFWYCGILLLFGCFGSVGVVFGNIVQSTRGVMSIAMGSYVAHKGYDHIEEKVPARILLMRIIAGLLMIGSIALFYLGWPRPVN